MINTEKNLRKRKEVRKKI
jgi:hypothetical protein